mmetsp:Transcript_100/g.254  ORF Transcript_100/g.254 Transcript_100/m.254 type:complete len:205 (+) Transcript_100:893-1507(+)
MRRPGQVCAALRVRVPRGRVVREQRRAPRVARAVQPDLLPLRVRHDARRRRRRELEQARAFHQLLHAGRPGELAEGRAAGPLHLFALGADGPFLRRVEALHAHRAAPAQLALADAREFALGKALEGRRRRRRVRAQGHLTRKEARGALEARRVDDGEAPRDGVQLVQDGARVSPRGVILLILVVERPDHGLGRSLGGGATVIFQ